MNAPIMHVYLAVAVRVLLCLVCLFDLACFFLSSFSSLIIYIHVIYTSVYDRLATVIHVAITVH